MLGALALNLLLVPENSTPQRSDIFWVLIACIASICYAIENLLIDVKMPEDIGPIRIACGMNFIGAILVLPFTLAFSQSIIPVFPLTSLELSVIGLGLINALAYTTFIFLIKKTGPVFASQTGYVVTVGGMIWGMALFGETYTPWVWTSLFVIIFGVILVAPRKKKISSKPKKNKKSKVRK